MTKKTMVVGTRDGNVKINTSAMAKYQTDAMCRTLLSCISDYFKDPAVQARYKKWKEENKCRT